MVSYKMIKKIKVVEEVEERYCDDCGLGASHKCHFCRKDLCGWMQNGCAVQDDRDNGDYPDYYCKQCWKIGIPYRKQIKKLEDKEWKLEQEWEKAAKKMSKK